MTHSYTKIVATLGPATDAPGVVENLLANGADAFRLNLSHGDHQGHLERFHRARRAAEQAGAHVPIFADLAGPKIRVGTFPDGGIELVAGAAVTVTVRSVPGAPDRIPVNQPALATDLQPGNRLLLDDGRLELRVESVGGEDIGCTVVAGGRLTNRKGMNLPDADLSLPALTDKDREDAMFAAELGVDAFALSFVRRPDDILALRELLQAKGRLLPIIAKVEKPEAVAQLGAIVQASEGILVARGDLGVELPPEDVPAIQDDLVRLCRMHHRPVIVATQMLESMIHDPRPTRAEVADVAHAVQSGADALMLSGETAVGHDPAAAVAMMSRVIGRTEDRLRSRDAFASLTPQHVPAELLTPDVAVSRAVAKLAREIDAVAILTLSVTSGHSIAIISSARPPAPMLAVSSDPSISRRQGILWGVRPVQVAPERLDDPEGLLQELARNAGCVEAGTRGLVVRGFSRDPAASRPQVTVVPLVADAD